MTVLALITLLFSMLNINVDAQLPDDLPIAGDNLALWQCGAQQQRQTFNYSLAPGPLQYHFTVHGTETTNPLVWDINGPSNNSGTSIHVWGSYPGTYPSQQWKLVPARNGVQVVSQYNGMCAGVDSGAGAAIGSPIGMYTCDSNDTLQQWTYDQVQGLLTSVPGLCAQAGNNTPSCDIPPFSTYPYCNATLPIAARLRSLLGQMSAADMARAMDASIPSIPRLGVPSMGSGEALHGAATRCLSDPTNNGTGCPTSFPCPMALAATFDAPLWAEVGMAIGMEARALYNAGAGSIWLFAPNINPCRDPRWGRCQEVPGEDSFVVSQYATQFISGLQGQGGPDPRYLLAASTAKHFVAYDLEGFEPRTDPLPRPPTGTCDTPSGCQRWNFDASPLPQDLSGYFLPPFQSALEAGVRSVMCAYNGVYGQPSCASGLIQTLLRGGNASGAQGPFPVWDGHVVSDATAIELMQDSKWDSCKPPFPPLTCTPDPFPSHNYTHTVGETALAALDAGVDVNLGPFFSMWLEALVHNGTVPSSALESAVTRIYTTAIKLGLLDPTAEQVYPHLPPSTVDAPEHRQLALQAAREGIVLLANPSSLLPMKVQSSTKVAFIGPHANSTQAFLSNYHGENRLVNSHSPLQVAVSRGMDVTYAPGCNICDVVPPGFPNMPCPPNAANDTKGIAAAVSAAAAADVAVLFLGADQTSEAENFDRSDIGLLGVQELLARAVIAAQPQTIVVLISGGIVCSPWLAANAPALLYSFYPGELGGDALVDVLTGAYNPGGKLPVTMYYPNMTTARDMRDLDLRSGQGITHGYFTGPVLFPYGYGLSYTTWAYQAGGPPTLKVRREDLIAPQSAMEGVSLLVTNTGSTTGDCVVLAFVEREEGEDVQEFTSSGPRRSLFAFKRVRDVQPGEEARVNFALPDATRGSAITMFNQEQGRWVPRAGTYIVSAGDVSAPARLRLQVT